MCMSRSVPHGVHTQEEIVEQSHEHAGHDMTVSSDREFLVGMIPHHEEAVYTAQEVLERGATRDEIRVLAQAIITTQEQEIAQMKLWHEEWYGEPYRDAGTYEPMMRPLASLSGEALDRAFLEDMIVHHEGALRMAESLRGFTTNPQLTELADTIQRTQADEIASMQSYLELLASAGVDEAHAH
jgi:uncharacterized protein (DUF305 family)